MRASFASTWTAWWVGDMLGDLVVAPLLLTWLTPLAEHAVRRRAIEIMGLAAALVVLDTIVFGPSPVPDLPLTFLAFPPLVWAALRFDPRVAAISIVTTSALAIWFTVHGFGPFVSPDLSRSLLHLQLFMGVASTTTMIVAAVVTGSVAITQDSARIDVGATTQLTATVRDTLGSVINKPVTWMSLDNNVATVSSSGLVTGVAVGDVGIVAGREGKADTAIIHVNSPQAASVTISPSAADIGVGRTGRFNATPRDSAGNPLSRPLVWSSGDLAIATIDASTGLITAQATGATTIFAESNGKFATARLTVVATPVATLIPSTTSLVLSPGGTAQVSATVKDAGNNVLTNRLISFGSSGNIIATVDETGVATGVSPGAATISVFCEGITALIPVVVQ